MGAPNLVLAPGAIYPRYAPGRSKFGGAKGPPKISLAPPSSNLRSFESKCTVLKKVFVTFLGLYGASYSHSMPPAVIWRPHSDSAAGELCPRCPPALHPWYHADLLRNHGLHCRGVTRAVRVAQFPGRRINMGGAENPNSITSAFFNAMHLIPKDLRFEHGGAKVASCPGRHLTSLRLGCTGSMPETGFWLCKLPESCVSYKFSIAFLFSLLLFLSKLPSNL